MSKEIMNESMEKLKAAKSDEERKLIIESCKSVLSEDELAMVSGGDPSSFNCCDGVISYMSKEIIN